MDVYDTLSHPLARDGIAAGMITGTLVTIAWRLWLREPTGLYELVPGFALATLAIGAVSRAQRARS